MATGGYKCVSFSWQGGRTDSAVDRVKFILNGLCDAIVGANVGWVYDTLTPTSTDFLVMPTGNATNHPNLAKVLKLELNSHVYRLGIGLAYYALSIDMKPSDCVPCRSTDYNFLESGHMASGLYVGLIKDGTLISDNTYGWVWDTNGQFLRWTPFSLSYQSSASHSFASKNTSGGLYTYYALMKGAQIAFFAKNSAWSGDGANLKGLVFGELFKETGHSTDLNTLASIYLSGGGSNTDGEVGYPSATNYYGIITQTGTTNLDVNWNRCACHQVFKANGDILSGMITTGSSSSHSVTWCVALNYDTFPVSNYVSNVITSPGGRWTPCYLWVYAGDHDTYGIVPGDGFKGYIDTDLLRGVNPNYSYGQQLDNGKFVYLGGGFAIGWDPNNTTLLF
jgi:hypothetical protein